MKVNGAEEAIHCMQRRKAFRWNGRRGHKSKTAEGCYGVFQRVENPVRSWERVTCLMIVYEPHTKLWYTTEFLSATLRQESRLEMLPMETKWVDDALLLQDIYRRGYVALARRRIL